VEKAFESERRRVRTKIAQSQENQLVLTCGKAEPTLARTEIATVDATRGAAKMGGQRRKAALLKATRDAAP
jgi:hypothetical protein